jgi:hypothetical protein
MTDVAPRSSSELRAELQAIDVDLSALDGKLTSADVRLRGSALLARRGDPAAVKQVAEARSQKVAIGVEVDLTNAARVQLSEELQAALDREAQEARKAMSDEAKRFADEVGPLGAQLDEALATFKQAYTDLKGRLHQAELRGYGPSGVVVQSALTQSLRAALWRITELAIEAPHEGLGRSFRSLTASWSGAARGAAARLLAPPAASSPRLNGLNGSAPSAPSRPVPRPTDIGEKFADDPANFTIKDPSKELAR